MTSSVDSLELQNKFTIELKRNQFPAFLFEEIFEELKRRFFFIFIFNFFNFNFIFYFFLFFYFFSRVEKTPLMASVALKMIFYWCKYLPEKVSFQNIGEIWGVVMKFRGGNSMVVEVFIIIYI